tara:strand:+ start:5925 stop:6155 length:231 start_codon:yes stop_codon:yes gene_type:complete
MSENTNAVRIQTQSGEAIIDIAEIVAVVRHLPHREYFNVDIHMRSGTIFTAEDKTEEFFDVIRGFMCPEESTYEVE